MKWKNEIGNFKMEKHGHLWGSKVLRVLLSKQFKSPSRILNITSQSLTISAKTTVKTSQESIKSLSNT